MITSTTQQANIMTVIKLVKSRTGTVHKGFGGAVSCNTRSMAVTLLKRFNPNAKFCEKCFPGGSAQAEELFNEQ